MTPVAGSVGSESESTVDIAETRSFVPAQVIAEPILEEGEGGGSSDDVVVEAVVLPQRKGRRAHHRASRRKRTRRSRPTPSAPPVKDVDMSKMLDLDFAGVTTVAELPPVCAAPSIRIGSDGIARFASGVGGSHLASHADGVPILPGRRVSRSSKRSSRSSRRSRRSRSHRAKSSARRGVELVDRTTAQGSDEDVPVALGLPTSETSGQDVAPGCSTKALLLATMAVVFLAAIVVTAAVLVFNHGKAEQGGACHV